MPERMAMRWWPLAYTLFVCGFFFVPISKLHNNFYYAGLLLPALLLHPRERFTTCWASPLYRLALALIGWLAISNVWLQGLELGDLKQSLFHGLYVAVFLTLGVDLLHRGMEDTLLRGLAITVGLCAPLSMLWFYGGLQWGWVQTPDPRLLGLGRVDHPGFAASCYGVVAYLSVRQARRDPTARLGWLYAALVSLVFILLAGSRGAWLALLGSLSVVFCLGRRGGLWWLLLSLPLGYLLLVAGGILPFGELQLVPGGDSYRLAIWSQSLEHWLAAPWLGYGLGHEFVYDIALPPGHPVVDHPHSTLLGTALYGGLPALLLLLALIGCALWRAWRMGERALLGGLLLGSGFMLTDGARIIDNPQPVWVYFWLPLSLVIAGELRGRR